MMHAVHAGIMSRYRKLEALDPIKPSENERRREVLWHVWVVDSEQV